LKSNKPLHVYEVRPRKDQRGVDRIADVLPFGRLWHAAMISQYFIGDFKEQ
jgi:hypothetical protein